MKRSLLMTLTLLACFAAGFAQAGEEGHMMPPYQGSAEFERLKSLAGTWKGTHAMGETKEDVSVEYAVTSNGSVVLEKLFPGTPHEMVSVYTDDGGKVAMTHYCALGNHPKMDLVKAEEGKLEFVFSGNNTIDPAVEGHMHSLTIAFEGDNAITHYWTMYQEGQPAGETVISLTR